MPLIRYRTGDVSRFIPGNCPCGTILRSMEVVKRRISGKTILAGIDFSTAELDEVLFSLNDVLDYQSTLTETSGTERLILEIKIKEGNKTDPVAVMYALRIIPAIQQGIERGLLEIMVKESSEFMTISRGTVKRALLDTRKDAMTISKSSIPPQNNCIL